MTWGGRIVSLFPAVYLGWVVGGAFYLISNFHLAFGIGFLFSLYLIPVGLFRLHNLIWPLREGYYDLSERKYNPWWASHMFQFPFIACPWLESLLHFIPGLFPLWLRMWGSRVGRNIYFTPRVEILDRTLVEIGDRAVLGHLVAMSSHMVHKKDGRPMLLLRKVRIGEGALVGVDTQMGPGVEIEAQSKVPAKSRLYWRGDWNKREQEVWN